MTCVTPLFHIWCAAADQAKEQLLLEGLLKDLRIEAEVHVSLNCGLYVYTYNIIEENNVLHSHPTPIYTLPLHLTHPRTSVAPCTTLPFLMCPSNQSPSIPLQMVAPPSDTDAPSTDSTVFNIFPEVTYMALHSSIMLTDSASMYLYSNWLQSMCHFSYVQRAQRGFYESMNQIIRQHSEQAGMHDL